MLAVRLCLKMRSTERLWKVSEEEIGSDGGDAWKRCLEATGNEPSMLWEKAKNERNGKEASWNLEALKIPTCISKSSGM